MKIVRKLVAAGCVVCAGAALASAQQEKTAPAGAQSAQEQAMMAAYMKAAAPGPEHARLARLAGEWNATVRSWMTPGAPPQESTATSSNTMVFGGRYLTEKVTGTMMGAPFEGMGWTGYDNVMKRYEGAWIDNMGTAVMFMRGSWNVAEDTFTSTADEPDALTGKMTTMRMVTRVVSEDTHVSEFYAPGPDGKELKVMEITYTRKK
jgi:Protein of unknown function (DUF1579)